MRVAYGLFGKGCSELRERLCLCGVMERGGGQLCEILGEEGLDEAVLRANDGGAVKGRSCLGRRWCRGC